MVEFFKFLLSLFVSFVGIIIWPCFLLIFIFIFQSSIRNLIEGFWNKIHPSELNAGNLQMKFQEDQITNKLADENKLNKSIIDIEKGKSDMLQNRLDIASLNLHCEFIHNYIFRSQYILLQLMSGSEVGLSAEAIEKYFSFTPISKTSSWKVDDYLQFLISTLIIKLDTQTGYFKISEIGKFYLKYSQNIPIAFNLE